MKAPLLSHTFSVAFTVHSENTAEGVTADELRRGLQARLQNLAEGDEILEACGLPDDDLAQELGSFYAVSGCLCGDDGDTVLTFKAETKEDAIAQFYVAAQVAWGLSKEDVEALKTHSEGFYINGVLVSRTPIHEV